MAQTSPQTRKKPVGRRRRLGEWLDALLLLAVVQSLCIPYQTLDRHFARTRLVSLLDQIMNDFYPLQQQMDHSGDLSTPPPSVGGYSPAKLRAPGIRYVGLKQRDRGRFRTNFQRRKQ